MRLGPVRNIPWELFLRRWCLSRYARRKRHPAVHAAHFRGLGARVNGARLAYETIWNEQQVPLLGVCSGRMQGRGSLLSSGQSARIRCHRMSSLVRGGGPFYNPSNTASEAVVQFFSPRVVDRNSLTGCDPAGACLNMESHFRFSQEH